MKLRNKKTGEIGWLYCDHISVPKKMTVFSEDKDLSAHHWDYNSLAELNEKWEDYEEPKGINEIDVVLDAIGEYCNERSYYSGDLEKIKILNTVEEKLKAWKRLKDKGFEVDLWDYDGANYQERISTGRILFRVKYYGRIEENDKDLDLLFSQEGGDGN